MLPFKVNTFLRKKCLPKKIFWGLFCFTLIKSNLPNYKISSQSMWRLKKTIFFVIHFLPRFSRAMKASISANFCLFFSASSSVNELVFRLFLFVPFWCSSFRTSSTSPSSSSSSSSSLSSTFGRETFASQSAANWLFCWPLRRWCCGGADEHWHCSAFLGSPALLDGRDKVKQLEWICPAPLTHRQNVQA